MENYEIEMFISEAGIYSYEIIDDDSNYVPLIKLLKLFDEWAAKRRAEENERNKTTPPCQ